MKVRFSGQRGRKLQRRRRWVLSTVFSAGGRAWSYRVRVQNSRSAVAAADGAYWTAAKGRCGSLFGANPILGYTLDPPPIGAGAGGDIGRVRYYWYRFGVGWVGDSGWSQPFTIQPPPGAVFLGAGEGYPLIPGRLAWYAGAIAINWQYANETQWNWVPTFSENSSNPVDSSNTWCYSR